MNPLQLVLLLACGALPGAQASQHFTVWSVSDGPSAATTAEIHVAVLNTGEADVDLASPFFDADATVPAVLQDGGRELPVSLTPLDAPPSAPGPGQYARRRYRLELRDFTSHNALLILKIGNQPVCTLATDATAHERLATAAEVPASPPPPSAPSHRSAVDLFNRGFMDRFAVHEPVYFLYGPDDPAAKFQLSFKYRLSTLHQRRPESIPTTLQFGFTQRSLWDIDATSSPFYDTSYMPSVFIERLAPAPDKDSPGDSTWLGWQAGFRHESNGRDGNVSRSLNQVFVRGAFALGNPEGLSLVVIPEFWSYVGGSSNNPFIEDYRGHARLTLSLNHAAGTSLTVRTWTSDSFDHLTTQLDLNVPVRLPWIDLGTYLLIQYYNGYGESLLSYDQESETVRAGLAFVR